MTKKEQKLITFMQNVIEKTELLLNNNTHSDGFTYIAVNVKRYNDYVDLDILLDKIKINKKKLTKEQKDLIKSEFTQRKIESIWTNWIEYEANYYTNDFLLGKCTISSITHYKELTDKVLIGTETGYPHIDKLKTNEQKLKTIDKWHKYDRKLESYLNVLDNETVGFFGRSGGWLALYNADELESKKEELEYYLDESDSFDRSDTYLYSSLKEDAKDLLFIVTALNYLVRYTQSYNKNMKFEDELIFRIEEFLDEQ